MWSLFSATISQVNQTLAYIHTLVNTQTIQSCKPPWIQGDPTHPLTLVPQMQQSQVNIRHPLIES